MKPIVYLGDQATDLQVYVGTMTLWEEGSGALCCRDVIILAANVTEASVVAATKYPDCDLQSLTSLAILPWIVAIHLDEDCPAMEELREWVLEHVISVPIDDATTSCQGEA